MPPERTSPLRIARPIARLRQGRADWYRITNKAAEDTTEVYIYDEIGYFGTTAGDFVQALKGIETSKIDLHLNSPGGDVFDGIAIYNALKDHDATVTTRIDALAASIASVIAMAGDSITIAKSATMMIHDGHGLAIGNAADMREMADLLDRMSDTIAGIYADRAGGTVEEWRDRMRAETWFSAAEAVEAGLANAVRGADEGADEEDEDQGEEKTPDEDEDEEKEKVPAEETDDDEDQDDDEETDPKASWDLSIYSFAGRDRAPAPKIAAKVEPFDVAAITAALEGAFA
jgi:ATP-dependent protease ClpP protease subunit